MSQHYNSCCSVKQVMHQSIPAAPSHRPTPPFPVPGLLQCICQPHQSWGGAFANFVLPRGLAFANRGAIPELLTCTQFSIRIYLHRGFYWERKQIWSSVKDRKKLKRVVNACAWFYACISSLLIKPELHSEMALGLGAQLELTDA